MLAPVEARPLERELHQLPHAVSLAGGDYIVVGSIGLQHHPHRLYIISGESPVALSIQVAEAKLSVQAVLDAGHAVAHLARDELQPATRRFVVEEYPGAGKEVVALSVVNGDVVAVHLGDAVRAARVERSRFCLRHLAHLAEHL